MPTTLRRAVDAASILAAIGLMTGLGSYLAGEYRERQTVRNISADLERFRQVLTFKAASNQAEVNARGWPVTVDPEWFNGDPPRNTMVSSDRPWLEIATRGEAAFMDPPIRMTIDNSIASFWYNPYQGVVRARVPIVISDHKALQLYNSINRTHIDSIYGKDLPVEADATPPIDPALLFGPPAPTGADAAAMAVVEPSHDDTPAAPPGSPDH